MIINIIIWIAAAVSAPLACVSLPIAIICYKRHIEKYKADKDARYLGDFIAFLFYFVCGTLFTVLHLLEFSLLSSIGSFAVNLVVITLAFLSVADKLKESAFINGNAKTWVGAIIAIFVLTGTFSLILNA